MDKKFVWLIGPLLASALAWGFSGNWMLGFSLFIATGLSNLYAYSRLK